GIGIVLEHVWRSPCGADDAGRHRLAAVKELDTYPLLLHAYGGERGLHVFHEVCWPADVDVRVSWHTNGVEDRSRQVPCRLEIPSHLVVRAWPAVAHIAVAVREREHEATDFSGKGLMLLITSTMQPPDWSCRAGRCQGVQHRQHRRCSYSRAEQDHRALAGL